MPHHRFRSLWSLLALAALCVACGDDSSESTTGQDSGGSPIDDIGNTEGNGDGPGRNTDRDNGEDNNVAPVNLPPAQPVPDPARTQCGGSSCRDVLIGDIVVPPCCPENGSQGDDSCGLNLAVVEPFMPLQATCAELEQPGTVDGSCPSLWFDDPVHAREMPGCCMPEGLCGVVANFADVLADFGCVDPRGFLAGRAAVSSPEPEQSVADSGSEEIHLIDGGGYFVTDGGAGINTSTAVDAGDADASDGPFRGRGGRQQQAMPDADELRSCTPPPPPPDPDPEPETDAGGAVLDGGKPTRTDDGGNASSNNDTDSPAPLTDASASEAAETIESTFDGGGFSEVTEPAATETSDAGPSDAG